MQTYGWYVMKKRIIVTSIIVVFVMFLFLLAEYGRKEIVSVHNPSNSDYYIKIYQIGYIPNDEYKCLCILYGPNGEISNEQFNAISIESGNPKYMKEGYNINTYWTDEFAAVRVSDCNLGEVERKYYLDGRIILTQLY